MTHGDFVEDLQLLEDVKYLINSNSQRYILASYSRENLPAFRNIFDASRSTSGALRAVDYNPNSDYVDDREDVEGVLVSQICTTAMQSMKLSLIAHNFNDVINLGPLDQNQLYITP